MAIAAVKARNQFKGRIIEIVEGPVVSEVDVQTDGGIITSTITTRSIKHLKLSVGSEVLALVKSSDVVIATLRETDPAKAP